MMRGKFLLSVEKYGSPERGASRAIWRAAGSSAHKPHAISSIFPTELPRYLHPAMTVKGKSTSLRAQRSRKRHAQPDFLQSSATFYNLLQSKPYDKKNKRAAALHNAKLVLQIISYHNF